MFRGFYTVASGMIAQQRKTDMLTNNMSNVNTPGFKADQASLRAFPELLLSRMEQTKEPMSGGSLTLTAMPEVGKVNTGVYMQEGTPNFAQGDLRQTDRKTDVALLDVSMPKDAETGKTGSVFFTLEGANGTKMYTRNGNFTLDGAGNLTNGNGYYVVDDKGQRIKLPNDQFRIDENGQVFNGDQFAAKIGMGYAQNPDQLMKTGEGLYKLENNGVLANAYTSPNLSFRMQQGFLEGSNVDSAQTMTDLLSTYRTFEANQKVLQAYDRSMDKAVNEVGRVN
jgi:flagellar basal-body rod protein FlgF